MDIVYSFDDVPIRLTAERWLHIVESHDEMAGYYDEVLNTIENPQWILSGHRGSLIAVQNVGRKRYLMVIYRQVSREDGFVITAFFTEEIDRRNALWKHQ